MKAMVLFLGKMHIIYTYCHTISACADAPTFNPISPEDHTTTPLTVKRMHGPYPSGPLSLL